MEDFSPENHKIAHYGQHFYSLLRVEIGKPYKIVPSFHKTFHKKP